MPIAENGTLRLHYELTGADNEPVLMLAHSLGSNMHMWDKALPFLEKTYRIVRYDMRGHGQSSVPPPPYTLAQLGGDALFLLDYLGIDRAGLCGVSLGGLMTMWMGIHAPQRLSAIILANTAARIGTRKGWEERIEMVQASGMGALALASPERWFTQPYRERHLDEMDRARMMIETTDPAGYAGCCAALRDADLRGQIDSIETPCLVIAGVHDPVTTPSDGRAIQSVLRNARYIELEASHLSAWERAGEFAGAVLAFLETSRPQQEEHNDG